MKKSTKMFMTGAATLLAVALATGGAYAATGSLTTVDAPGQVLKVSGVGPASEHASENGLEHANPNAKGLFGWTDSPRAPKAKDDAGDKAVKDKDKDKAVKDKAAPADKPAKDTSATKKEHSSSVDDDDGDENESTSGSSGHVEAVAPDDAVEVDNDSEDAEDDTEDAEDSDDSVDEPDESDESDESDD